MKFKFYLNKKYNFTISKVIIRSSQENQSEKQNKHKKEQIKVSSFKKELSFIFEKKKAV